ncbi:uncharacterized protein LOC6545897 [Drosophila erecta]|nr:uncharacterized protein LOC6545897 [Drosophila erecta]
MRAYLLLALFGCVLLATVSANPVDIDDLEDLDEEKLIAEEQDNVKDDEEDDEDANEPESDDDLDEPESQDDNSNDDDDDDDSGSVESNQNNANEKLL